MIKHVTRLANLGFFVFPLGQNSKLPTLEEFTERASREVEHLKKLWRDPVMQMPLAFNVGIATSKFFDGSKRCGLLVVDVDVKEGKRGDLTLADLKAKGREFPETFTQKTPTGGLHIVYKCPRPVKQGVDVLGRGLDIRSRGGFIVGSGSEIDGKFYSDNGKPVAPAPQWLVDECNKSAVAAVEKGVDFDAVDQNVALEKAISFLEGQAPLAIQGSGGDATTFKVAARLRDFGLKPESAVEAMLDHWNDRCAPPWSPDELSRKVANAYAYAQNAPGALSAEADFDALGQSEPDPADDFIDRMNQKYAFVILGDKSAIVRKGKGVKGGIRYLNVNSFHELLAGETVDIDGKRQPVSRVWFNHKRRETYDDVGLYPEQPCPPGTLNTWAGFSCEPLKEGEAISEKGRRGFDLFIEHVMQNVCNNDEKLFTWLMGFYAHLIQRPFEKPLVALVFRGDKGTGKNAMLDCIGHLIRAHYWVASDRRYLLSNFNKHLMNLLLFVLDEALWSGDKVGEGILKGLVTSETHLIEPKGREAFQARNLTRVVIVGNEDWLVPATGDERRFAVFDVGNARQQDNEFFREMREGLEKHDGNRLLLAYLKAFDLSKVDVNRAPQTEALTDQKIESLEPIKAFWFACLKEGRILHGSEFDNAWPENFTYSALNDAFMTYAKVHRVSSWLSSHAVFAKRVQKFFGKCETVRKNDGHRIYKMPPLSECRARFEKSLRASVDWENDAPKAVELDDVLS